MILGGKLPQDTVSPGGAESGVRVGDDLPEVVIKPGTSLRLVDLKNLWNYREVLYFLVWRDIKIRYKQTVLGVGWAILQPLALMAAFTLFLRPPEQTVTPSNYRLFVLAGLLPWVYLANAVTAASQSVVANQNLVTKVYFPRLLIPIGAVAAGLVDFVITLVILLAFMIGNSVWPGWGVLWAPVFFLGIVLTALGIGIILSALTVAYRDFRHAIPFLVMFWMFVTPSAFPLGFKDVGPEGQFLLLLNPAHGLIRGFRDAILGGPLQVGSIVYPTVVSLVLLLGGLLYFRRAERGFADII